MAVDQHAVIALALARLPGVGRRRLRALVTRLGLERIGSAVALTVWVQGEAPALRLAPPSAATCETAWREAVELAQTCGRRGWHVWALGGAGYPDRLGRLTDPPALLFVQGPDRWPDAPSIAIVGTREPTPWGERAAAACADAAARAGAVVVSGLAWGIDTAAHAAVVAARSRTWATLPGGLDIVFPSSNRALAARIVECGGALVSEYEPGTRPHPTFFVERDRLQAALADVVLVVETGRSGGTHHTIRFARELNVPVWVTLPADVVSAGRPAGAAPRNAGGEPERDGLGVGAPATTALASERAPAGLPPPQQGTFDLWRAGCPVVTPDDVRQWSRKRQGEGERVAGPRQVPPAQGRLFDG